MPAERHGAEISALDEPGEVEGKEEKARLLLMLRWPRAWQAPRADEAIRKVECPRFSRVFLFSPPSPNALLGYIYLRGYSQNIYRKQNDGDTDN